MECHPRCLLILRQVAEARRKRRLGAAEGRGRSHLGRTRVQPRGQSRRDAQAAKLWEIYGCFKLLQKDAGRPFFHVLVREPSREEISDDGIKPYMIVGGPLPGKILLRIRSVQGHSGARAQNMMRINQKVVPRLSTPRS